MITSQLLSPKDFLSFSQSQLDNIDTVIEAEIIKSPECMAILKQKLEQDFLPVIRELHKKTKLC